MITKNHILMQDRVNESDISRLGLNRSQAKIKRCFDVTFGLILLLIIAPVMLIIIICIVMDSPGPLIFRQRRLGLNGKEFTIYKFRTLSTLEDGDSIQQVTKYDARVTNTGSWLRRRSLDELPQIFNVLKGEMSLVGPRPHAVADDKFYETRVTQYGLRQKIKPGITGWAQIHDLRGEIRHISQMTKRVHYDIDYIHNWSFLLDIRIILKTIQKGFSSEYAY